MNNTDWNFRLLDREERAALYREHMTRDFPDSELKPLSMLEDLLARGINSVWGCFYRGELAGYYVLAQEPGSQMILLDYLAVLPERRGTGCGSMVLGFLRQQLPTGSYLLIESELPQAAETPGERLLRKRRVAFYRRSGALLSPLTVRLFQVDYAILTLGNGAPPPAWEQEAAYRSLYQKMLPKERFQRKVVTYLPDNI